MAKPQINKELAKQLGLASSQELEEWDNPNLRVTRHAEPALLHEKHKQKKPKGYSWGQLLRDVGSVVNLGREAVGIPRKLDRKDGKGLRKPHKRSKLNMLIIKKKFFK
jgi:hypothetical protein